VGPELREGCIPGRAGAHPGHLGPLSLDPFLPHGQGSRGAVVGGLPASSRAAAASASAHAAIREAASS
jgi:hypothetical protein